MINGEITSFTHVFDSPFKRPEQKENENQMLLWGSIVSTKQGERYVIFLNASLEPLRSTTDIMKSQLFYVTLLLIATAFAMSWLISRRLSKPYRHHESPQRSLKTCVDIRTPRDYPGVEESTYGGDPQKRRADACPPPPRACESRKSQDRPNVSHDLRTPRLNKGTVQEK